MVKEVTRVSYHRLNSEEVYSDAQFRKPPTKTPVRAIATAVVLFVVGTVLLTVGALIACGILVVKEYSTCYALIALGAITFIPGSYHTWIACQVWRGKKGYSFELIPCFVED
ncbi:transmembrane protein 230-like [Oscarella lobularis]|uniref:transmembrane protein 230-like n=1 Tax=Oscarella lobularis TaxID=121494 RepID=UPI0033133755